MSPLAADVSHCGKLSRSVQILMEGSWGDTESQQLSYEEGIQDDLSSLGSETHQLRSHKRDVELKPTRVPLEGHQLLVTFSWGNMVLGYCSYIRLVHDQDEKRPPPLHSFTKDFVLLVLPRSSMLLGHEKL